MTSDVVRSAIVDVLKTVPQIGQVHERERYSKNANRLKEFYVDEGVLAGGFVRRTAMRRQSPDGGYTFTVLTTWELHYFRAFSEDNDSESDFDQLLDAMDRAFVLDQSLGGTIDTIVGDEQAALQLLTSQPAMFAGVLVHYAKFRLITEHTDGA